jgi:hypothetical protein
MNVIQQSKLFSSTTPTMFLKPSISININSSCKQFSSRGRFNICFQESNSSGSGDQHVSEIHLARLNPKDFTFESLVQFTDSSFDEFCKSLEISILKFSSQLPSVNQLHCLPSSPHQSVCNVNLFSIQHSAKDPSRVFLSLSFSDMRAMYSGLLVATFIKDKQNYLEAIKDTGTYNLHIQQFQGFVGGFCFLKNNCDEGKIIKCENCFNDVTFTNSFRGAGCLVHSHDYYTDLLNSMLKDTEPKMSEMWKRFSILFNLSVKDSTVYLSNLNQNESFHQFIASQHSITTLDSKEYFTLLERVLFILDGNNDERTSSQLKDDLENEKNIISGSSVNSFV